MSGFVLGEFSEALNFHGELSRGGPDSHA